MAKDRGADKETAFVASDPTGVFDVPSVPGEPSLYSLHARLVQARRARRTRLARRAGSLVLLTGALALLSVLLTSGLSFLRLPSAPASLAPPIPSRPDDGSATPTRGIAVSVGTAIGTNSDVSSVSATTATNLLLRSGTTPSAEVVTHAWSTLTPSPSASSITGIPLPLAGRRIGLDPGHGPRGDLGVVLIDPGTGKLLLSEAEFNLDVALRCRDLLVTRGAVVVLTRETADTFTAPWPTDANGDGTAGGSGDDLQERVDILNNFHAEVFLSIHANGRRATSGVGRDIQVLYCGTGDCNFPAQSKRLGQLVLDQLTDKLDAAGYSVQGSQLLTDLDADTSNPPQHLFLLGPTSPPRHVRPTLMPGVVGESLYVSSPQQAAELKKSSVRQAIARAYADALQAYLTGGSSGGR